MFNQNLYFIALIPRRELRERINLFKQDFANRFNSRKALKVYPHITLKAPFTLSENGHYELVSWFKDLYINQQPYMLQLNGFGAFQNKESPVVYINPVPSRELMFMQKELIASFSSVFPACIHVSDIRFKPHVTIAYRDLSPAVFQKVWAEYQHKKFSAEFDVNSIYLLKHDTRQWNVIETYHLPENIDAAFSS